MTAPQPGWYPNPDGSGDLRYWDGQSWTQQRRPPPADVTPTPMVVPEATEPGAVQWPPTAAAAPLAATGGSEGVDDGSLPEEPGPESVAAAQVDAGAETEPGEPAGNETIQFPPAPPEPEFNPSDTMQFPQPGPDAPAAPPVAGSFTPPVPPPPPPAAQPGPPVMPPPPPVVPDAYSAAYGAPAAGFEPPVGGPVPAYYPPAATQSVVSGGGSGAGIAALIVGILSVILSLFCGFFAVPLSIAAGVLGFVGISQANKTNPPSSKGMAIAGIVLAVISLFVMAIWVVFVASVGSTNPNGF